MRHESFYDGLNAHGFSAKQTGYRSSSNGSSSYFYSWSSSRQSQYLWYRQLSANNQTFRSNQELSYGLSIRCVQERTGCDDEDACNYNAAANLNDGSCDYSCNGWVAADGSGPCNGSDNINYDGTSYPLVEIGDQCWFQTNLNTTTFANGDAIPLIYDAQEWRGHKAGASRLCRLCYCLLEPASRATRYCSSNWSTSKKNCHHHHSK